ncbi:hypothetical protein IE53DRAFT_383485 [Violaceomyces palustris]|uniref:Uncharacterized protein n=1 Tax=Violaceomyces palustris TaxID=1673888 RepID=A0ACD0P7E4_9BASI|nr:hypothetical protein IE53DRAFT_383485 [Violaceomyces palustris]
MTKSTILPLALSGLLALQPWLASAATWNQTSSFYGQDFYKWDFFNQTDPTNGLVRYLPLANAKYANLTYAEGNTFVMKVDTVEQALDGRQSIRISSPDSYSDGVYVLNVSHVPLGCSTWPAFWTVTENLDNWPVGGEIDIMENANDEFASNLVSLHTKSSCTIPSSISDQTGMVAYTNCSAYTPENTGCRVEMNGTSTPTWGTKLNMAGGGVIAMERAMGSTGSGVRVWYWANDQATLPSDLKSGSSSVDPSTWGTPAVHFDVADNCHSDFGPHKITFDITLCGDWAAQSYISSGCAATYGACSSQVAYNGSSYSEAYWEIQGLRVFATGGGNDNSAKSPNTHIATTSGSAKVSPFLVGLGTAILGLAAATLA